MPTDFPHGALGLVSRLNQSEQGKAEIGPLKIGLGRIAQQGHQMVGVLQQLSVMMADSRLLELEITEGNFANVFSDEQQERMRQQIVDLTRLLEDVRMQRQGAVSAGSTEAGAE